MPIRSRIYPKSIGDVCVTTFMFLIIPVIYYFELWIVLPTFHTPWCSTYIFHFTMGNFILFNLSGNLINIILTDTSIKGRILPAEINKNWRFCTVCEAFAPPRSWHCPTCNECILKRDHHCLFTSCCIGHYNHRYFLVFVFYIFIATLYSSMFNIQFILDRFETVTWLSIVKLVFPLAILFLEWSLAQFYVALIIIVTLGCLFTGTLLWYHGLLIAKGLVTHERKEKLSVYDRGYIENIKVVLGTRWYLVWISPFIRSELPCDGVEWITNVSVKGK
ncbi:hypothetical protein ABEB36_001859 [Hypothenemus hampei]|uniref:Palmitoyltransferase n=1 Tax=Hypothenemus hampei TaxID=57062 RepID=A0ABD1FHW1_HYPHA